MNEMFQYEVIVPDILFTWSDEAEGVSCVEGRGVAHRFPRHAHDSLCVGLVTAGRWHITRGDETLVVNKGSAYIINPNEAHECESEGASSYITVCVKRARMIRFCEEALLGQGDLIFSHTAITDAELASLIQNLSGLFQTPSTRIEKESAFEALLGHVITRYGKAGIESDISQAAVKGALRAKEYMDDHLDEDISLHELSGFAGVSPFFLTRSFAKTYGVPPHLYLMQTRIKRAQRDLIEGKRIVDVALECGFYDQSHFSRIFLRETGMTPGEFLICNERK
jgi:AraC-like DNA-binding protein